MTACQWYIYAGTYESAMHVTHGITRKNVCWASKKNYTNDLRLAVFRCGLILIDFTHIPITFLTRLLVDQPHGNIHRMALIPHAIHTTFIWGPFC